MPEENKIIETSEKGGVSKPLPASKKASSKAGIKLIFTSNREVFTIDIKDKIIHYKDRKQSEPVMFMPKDPEMRKKVLFSRNRIPKYILDLIEDANSGHNLEEYQACKTDEDIVPIVIRDAKVKGCLFQKRMDIE